MERVVQETELPLRVDFAGIREHRNTQMGGFEELCCQLAALEDPAEGSRFVRKGPGPDLNRHEFSRHSRAVGNTAFHIQPATSHC